jgi:hypothetical protein
MRREGGVLSAEGRAKLTGSVDMEPKPPTLNTTREIQIVHEAVVERIERALALPNSAPNRRRAADLRTNSVLPAVSNGVIILPEVRRQPNLQTYAPTTEHLL